MWVIVGLFALLLAVGSSLAVFGIIQRRRRRRWNAEYQRRGGLAGSLYRRRHRVPQLTYRGARRSRAHRSQAEGVE